MTWPVAAVVIATVFSLAAVWVGAIYLRHKRAMRLLERPDLTGYREGGVSLHIGDASNQDSAPASEPK